MSLGNLYTKTVDTNDILGSTSMNNAIDPLDTAPTYAHYSSSIEIEKEVPEPSMIADSSPTAKANGYGVQITLIAETACYKYGGDPLTYRVQVKVKGSGEYFNPVSLAYWLTCPSVLRRLNFRHREGEPADIQEKIGSGYGSTADVPKDELDAMQDCIYFGAIESNDTGQYTRAIEQIMEQYKA